ncbi:hypothetical protein M406DRAFT_69482 [Cryphonectria parasitica EP155]|uniref:Peptidase A1 domain-containing protein n=1 Tax=Cryphonectria parasitica (strain ATCC 38755 / EP155) TaxID=660469 RepID=A0A9P5CRA6_CRYP1|nr:uncharacterized protein M406DRAFT_69482 [Cryphonectria parasitica EP155]KAF3767327.1 hypothetical protein M406DRAFT_69482 [Cryphonectria parasitica EP155]
MSLAVSSTSQASYINAPLTDWIKNGHTDLQWYTTISVGTPPRNFTVLIDTGSHNLILPEINCTTCPSSQRQFDPTASSTFSWSALGESNPRFSTGGDTVPLAEPQGAQCRWAVDDVSMQGLTAPSFTFLLCHEEDEAMTTQPGIDGILGLGLNGTQPESFQYALYNAALLSSGVFILYMPSGKFKGGQLVMGTKDTSKLEVETVWLSLNRELSATHSQWTMNMQTIFINGQQLVVHSPNTTSSSSAKTPYPQSLVQALDTGTSFIMAPDNATAAALYAQISPKIYQIDPVGTWGCSCKDMEAIVKSGAELTFLLGYDSDETQMNVTIPSSVFNLGPYPGTDDICQAVVNNWQDGVFYNGIGLWELGSPMLKNYVTAWDGLGLRVGFAPLHVSASVHSSTGSVAAPTARRS